MLSILLLASVVGMQEAPVEPRHWNSVTFATPPHVSYPDRERGVPMVRLKCGVGEGGRPVDCAVERRQPEETRLGTRLLRAMPASRLAPGEVRPGDTFTLDVWICPPSSGMTANECPRPEWQVDEATPAD
jgi:hypothetical protein